LRSTRRTVIRLCVSHARQVAQDLAAVLGGGGEAKGKKIRPNELLTADEMCSLLRVGPQVLRNLVRLGAVKAVRFGHRTIRYLPLEIDLCEASATSAEGVDPAPEAEA